MLGLFDSYFLKLFLRTNFENIENIIFMFTQNCFCSKSSVFCVSRNRKKLRTNCVLYVFFIFLFFKTITKQTCIFFIYLYSLYIMLLDLNLGSSDKLI